MQSRIGPVTTQPVTAIWVGGLTTPLAAARLLLGAPKLKRFAILPLAANTIVYGLVVVLAFYWLANWQPQVGPWDFGWDLGALAAKSLNLAMGPLKWLVGLPIMLLACYFTFTTVGMIVASPFNDILSERVERHLCHPSRDPVISTRQLAVSMAKSLIDSLVIVIRQIAMTLLVLPLLLIPVVGFLPLLLVTAHYTGLGLVDVAMARNHLRPVHKRTMIRDRRWEIFGLGLAMEFLFFVPGGGLLVLPVGVTAGTLLYCQYDWIGGLAQKGLSRPKGFRPPQPVTRSQGSISGHATRTASKLHPN